MSLVVNKYKMHSPLCSHGAVDSNNCEVTLVTTVLKLYERQGQVQKAKKVLTGALFLSQLESRKRRKRICEIF